MLLPNFAFFFLPLHNWHFSPNPNILSQQDSQDLIGAVYSQSYLTSDSYFHSWSLKRQKLLFLEVTFLNEASCYFTEVQGFVCMRIYICVYTYTYILYVHIKIHIYIIYTHTYGHFISTFPLLFLKMKSSPFKSLKGESFNNTFKCKTVFVPVIFLLDMNYSFLRTFHSYAKSTEG